MSRISVIIWAVIIGLLVSLGWAASHYRDNANEYKRQRDDKSQALDKANSTITNMKKQQRNVSALDAKYTQELADAKQKLDDLQRCISTGKCGLRINARCPASGNASTTGMDDAAEPRLTDTATRNYFTLRERIATSDKQIAGLQDYIRNVCLAQ